MTRKEEIEQAAQCYYEDKMMESERVQTDDIPRSFGAGAEWADKTMLDRFSRWLFKNITHRVSNGIGSGLIINFDSYSDMVEDLRKAMEE